MRRRDWKTAFQAIGKWRRRQPDHMRLAGFDLVDPHGHLHMRFIDHDQIRVRPLAACERLSAGNLKRALTGRSASGRPSIQSAPSARSCPRRRCLSINVRRSQTKMARLPFAAPHELPSPRKVFPAPVAAISIWQRWPFRPLPQRLVRLFLKWPAWECRRRVLRRIVEKAVRRHAATFSHFAL